MSGKERHFADEPYDAIVIGAGISGIIFLEYAVREGLRCLVLEKQDDVGGLWNWIPEWQDIQNRKEDFAINDTPLEGDRQPDVQNLVRNWVRKSGLEPFIRFRCEVSSVSWSEDRWRVKTNDGEYGSRYLVVASGVQNEPWTPEVARREPDMAEIHSSALQRPEELAGKRITVVGGGASALDMLELAVGNGARDIRWVYRGTRWFFPSSKSKQENPLNNLRRLSLIQTMGKPPEAVSERVQGELDERYKHFHLESIRPAYDVDFRKHQVFPGRPLMIRNLDAISPHRSEVAELHGNEVVLKNGERLETDAILWGTGYRMNLAYLGLPEFRDVRTVKQLYPKLGSLVRSLDYPSLFFVGMWVIESNTSTPFAAAVEARTIVAHIRGRCEIPMTNIPHHINHWNLFKFFARFDHATYPRYWWRVKYAMLALWYLAFRKKLVRV